MDGQKKGGKLMDNGYDVEYVNKQTDRQIDEMRSLIDENKQLKSQLADYQDKNKLVLKVDITETDKFKTVAEQLAEALELLKLSANYANNYSGWWSFQGYQDRYEKLKSEVEKNG
jgi:hypothetical protein